MARGIRPAAVLIAALIALVAIGSPAAAEPTPGGPVTVTVRQGQKLEPGEYDTTVRSGGKDIDVTIVVPPEVGQAEGQTGVTPTEPAGGGRAEETEAEGTEAEGTENAAGIGQILLLGLALLLVAVGGAMLYLRVLAPRRYLRPYLRALAHIEAKRYDLALPALTRIEATLPEQARAEARFFIAFAMYRLDDRQAAEHRLAELHREAPANVEVAYLLAQLRADRRDFDGAEAVLDRLDPAVRDVPGNVRKLYGVVTAQRAFAAFRDGRVDAAAELFEKVERLDDFAEHVPVDLRNRNILVGTKALFERDVPAARQQFESLLRAAGRIDGTQRGPLLASAELGLGLSAWLAKGKDSPADSEWHLVAALALLDPAGALTAQWPPESADPGLTARIEEMMIRANRPAEEIEGDRTLRDIHFLRGMAVLRAWAESDPRYARSAAGDFIGQALQRFARARELDPEFSDVYVVVGLLRYYLAESENDRRAGVAVLREAQKLGTRDPEVLQILNHDERVRRVNRDAAATYLQILDRYVQDSTVREQVREALLARMSRYGKVRDWDTRPGLIGRRVSTPTVAEMHARSELLMARINDLVQNQGGTADLSGARQLTVSIEQRSREIAEYARAIEDQEAELLALLGDKLLSEVET
ncbi:tetratricopeptide repeat protein [Micromonospora taraxaci]